LQKLKLCKGDGTIGLCSEHIIHGCNGLAAHISLLFSVILIHDSAPDDISSATIIPIPKGRHAVIIDSSNYSAIFNKVFDLIFSYKYSDCLCCVPMNCSLVAKPAIPLRCVPWY